MQDGAARFRGDVLAAGSSQRVGPAGALPQGPPDGEVVRLVRGGDREAYRLLVRRYQDGLYRYALHMTRQPDTAADLAQGALVKAYTELHRCREPDRFAGWLMRILVNSCKDWLKSRRRKDVSLEAADAGRARSTTDPASELERTELRNVLDAALATLPEPQRQAFVLKHVEGRSYEEIADLLDISVPALKMRVHRARETLKATLEKVL